MKSRSQRAVPVAAGPFSRRVDVKDIPASGLAQSIFARPEECAAVAAATDLPALKSLRAEFDLQPRAGGRVELFGTVYAEITERCVVSLDPFEEKIDQPVELVFAPVAAATALPAKFLGGRGGITIEEASPRAGNDDQSDPPEPLVDGIIDLGAVAVEFLSLARDPYPKKADAQFDDVIAPDDEVEARTPFAALASLKDRS